jgi:hypothetical protein
MIFVLPVILVFPDTLSLLEILNVEDRKKLWNVLIESITMFNKCMN